MSDGKHIERITDVFGKWIIIETNEDAIISYNGMPSSTKKSDELASTPKLFMPEGTVDKELQMQNVEAVYQVKKIGPNALEATRDMYGAIVSPAIAINEGDFVLAKGHVFKMYTKPVTYAVLKEHIVAKVNIEI